MVFELRIKENSLIRKSSESSVQDLSFVTLKCDSDYTYAKISFNYSNPFQTNFDGDVVFFKNSMLKILAEIFGEMNSHIPVDILRFDHAMKEVIIRCDSLIFQRLTCSLLFNKQPMFQFSINKSSYNNPLYLMFDSRSYSHCTKRQKYKKAN